MDRRYGSCIVLILVVLGSGLLQAQSLDLGNWEKWKWGVGLRPGMNSYSMGDLATAKDRFLNDDNAVGEQTVKDFSSSFTWQANTFAQFKYKENLEFGFSLGFWDLGGGTYRFKSSYDGFGKFSADTYTQGFDVRAVGVPFELYAMMPLAIGGQDLMARVGLGVMAVHSTVKYSSISSGTDYSHKSSGSFSDSGIGSNISVGAEYQASSCLFLKFIMGFMCARLDNFEGDYGSSGSESRQRLVTWDDDYGYSVGPTSAADPCEDSDPFELAFRGFYVQAGVQWYFPCCF